MDFDNDSDSSISLQDGTLRAPRSNLKRSADDNDGNDTLSNDVSLNLPIVTAANNC
jgi:hypothetical protein